MYINSSASESGSKRARTRTRAHIYLTDMSTHRCVSTRIYVRMYLDIYTSSRFACVNGWMYINKCMYIYQYVVLRASESEIFAISLTLG